MFDFEKLELYSVARELNRNTIGFILKNNTIDQHIKDQWKRASLNIVLNLAEGTGRMTDVDKKHFFTIARGSVFESVALLQLVKDLGQIADNEYLNLYNGYEQVSKMLLGMYRSKA